MKILGFIKKFILGTLLFIIKEIFSFVIKFTLMLIVIGGIAGAILKYSMEEEKPTLKNGSYVEIDLGKEYPEKLEALPKFLMEGEMNFYSILKKLDSIKDDSRVEGVFLKIDNLTLDRAQISELGDKLELLKKSGKKVISYGINLDNRNYLLAIHSDKIFMPPTMTAGVNIAGYYNQLPYYKGLADKLGVKFNVIHVGDYKSYGENYVRETMSQEYRSNIVRMLDKVYENFIEEVTNKRGISKDLFNERVLAGDFVSAEPYQMKKFNLIDDFAYENEIKDLIGSKRIVPIEEYEESSKISKEKIAVIYGEGSILLGGEKGNIGKSITPESIFAELDRAVKDDSIKGIVLRINSPGGSALASNLINKKVRDIGKIKPVYISIGGVAASGGYYIAVAGDKIFADKESITGSIGVVSLIPNFNELMNKIDVNIESIKKGEYSDLYSLTKKFSAQDEEKIYASSVKVYSEFLDVVAQGRGLDRNYVHTIAQGKVWLGEEGKELGLIDEIGGLEKTIESLAKDLKLKDYSVVEIKESEKLDKILKNYLPFRSFFEGVSETIYERELYFKPIYFFPYNM